MVPLTSDRGLAGGFNANVFRAAAALRRRAAAGDAAGARGRAGDRRQEGPRLLPPPQGRPSATSCPGRPPRPRCRSRARWRTIVTHDFIERRASTPSSSSTTSSSRPCTQRVVVEPLLPITRREPARAATATPRRDRLPLRAVEGASCSTRCCRCTSSRRSTAALLESMASRVRRAHDRDGQRDQQRQGDDRRLTLQYNRARQAAITKELMEIVGGAEALKG